MKQHRIKSYLRQLARAVEETSAAVRLLPVLVGVLRLARPTLAALLRERPS